MPKISVIIPIYNVDNYLKECLSSVTNQTFKDIEIILVDDCGNDDSMQIAREFALKDDRIRIIRHAQNKGLALARNTGLKEARSEYVFFLDSDDYIKEDVLEKLYQILVEADVDIAISNSLAFTKEQDSQMRERVRNLNNWLNCSENHYLSVNYKNFLDTITYKPCVAWGRLYRKKFLTLNNISFINENRIHEDNGFWLKICANFPKIFFTTDVGVMYRIRKNAITTDIDKPCQKYKKYEHLRAVLEDVFLYLDKNFSSQDCDLFKTLIRASVEYNRYFLDKDWCFCKFYWRKHEKMIRLLGITLFNERIAHKGMKRGRLFGIQIYKKAYELNLLKDLQKDMR